MFKDWELIRKEGEDPTPVEEEAPKKEEKKKGGKAPPPKAKGGAKGKAIEEITDNNPRVCSWEESFHSEDAPVEVSEDYVRKLSKEGVLEIKLFDLNKETQEEIFVDSVKIDLSCLIFPATESVFEWQFDKL